MAINLNDRSVVTENDPHGILALTEGFPRQCREALEIAKRFEYPLLEDIPGLVVLAGMGGSAAGGDFVRALFEEHGGAAFIVVRDYRLPNYVGVGDLVVCASYSGNTEETLAIYDQAKSSGAKILAITSGGTLKERAEADGHMVMQVPGGQPPRTAMGYMMIPVIYACTQFKVLHEQPFEEVFTLLESCARAWGPGGDDSTARDLAPKLHCKIPILYGLGTWAGLVANRWRSQINENSKQLAFFNSYPELNHNEILGWVTTDKPFVGVLLQLGDETDRMKTRAKITQRLVGEKCEFQSVSGQGESLMARMLSLAFLGDFVSVYLARMNGVDPENIDSINTLKEELGKI